MKLSPRLIHAALLLPILSTISHAQPTELSNADPVSEQSTTPIIAQSTLHTLNQITAEQDWIARSPQNPRWLIDGSAIKFSMRRPGLVGRDFSDQYLLFLSNPDAEPAKITPQSPGPYFINSGDWNTDHTLRLLNNNGDLFIYDVIAQSTTQLTKTSAYESAAMFLPSSRSVFTRYAFRRDNNWFIRNLDSGWEFQAADVQFKDEPKDPSEARESAVKKRTELQNQQRELFDIINLEDQRKAQREDDRHAWRDTDPTTVPGPFYLGSDRQSQGSWLSPNARFMLVATTPKNRSNDKRDIMPNYINEDGYVSTRSVRAKVGLQSQTPVSFHLLNLNTEETIDIPFDNLPTIKDNPLEWLTKQSKDESIDNSKNLSENQESNTSDPEVEPKAEALKDGEQAEETDTKEIDPRPVSSMGSRWSDSGRYAAFMLRSHDNKDRWIVMIDTDQESPTPINAHHLRDEAWINWAFNEFGFIPNTETLWYLSEESGYSHLYTYDPTTETTTQQTEGNFEVRDITISDDPTNTTSFAYLRTNRTHPGIQELEQLDLKTNKLEPITTLAGSVSSYTLSPNQTQAIISYSNLNQPPELYLVELQPNPLLQSPPVKLTNTVTQEFKSANFQTPQIVAVPSSHTEHPIYTRLYLPDANKFPGPRPLVVFSHGAGYLQHANYEWSYYSREHMFHTILTNEGFIVVAPDFRASEGYGRDWRTAIYRKMGYPELEDFKDTIDYAVNNHNADPQNVGIYGGSYGGFMTLMALFLEPETYKAGAALRSVTDWRHYNHGYTANILNTPEIDPEAFDISSPINHAEGLQGHLLMLHGLQDNNVVAQDIIRLSQRLIELEKENWELALHPIEPHGYHEPSSWLDQMRRIHKLFNVTLNNE
ncbi:MAG: prolyl oligopeptidase family serine peptidase [Phycisphaerales bacterium]|nr:prolyl oligopeptidase family serine peptidase [Phycisphaerales bacterium]